MARNSRHNCMSGNRSLHVWQMAFQLPGSSPEPPDYYRNVGGIRWSVPGSLPRRQALGPTSRQVPSKHTHSPNNRRHQPAKLALGQWPNIFRRVRSSRPDECRTQDEFGVQWAYRSPTNCSPKEEQEPHCKVQSRVGCTRNRNRTNSQ